MTATGAGTDARRALLGRLIDHAALFPPASMSVPEAVAEDRRARSSEYAWMLARFVCPASSLEALGEEMAWPEAPGLSVVLDTTDTGPVEAAAAAGAPVEAVELRLPKPVAGAGALREKRRVLPWTAYFELPPGERPREELTETVAAVAAAGGRVKLRCGGEHVPTVEHVALVIAACRDAGCVFKATAGLHHPFRRGSEHGFLNLLVAAAFAHARNAAVPELERLLGEERPEAFSVSPAGLSAGGSRLEVEEIRVSREHLFAGLGSCSWREPVEDLRALGML